MFFFDQKMFENPIGNPYQKSFENAIGKSYQKVYFFLLKDTIHFDRKILLWTASSMKAVARSF